MTYWITGGAGFIGGHLAKALVAAGHQVHIIDNLSTGKREYVPEGATLWEFDITKDDFSVLPFADGIFHLAAMARIQPSIEDPASTFDNNVTGTLRVLEAARGMVSKVVFAASSSVYGSGPVPNKETAKVMPMNPYALTKLIGEQMMGVWNRLYKLPTVSCRFFNVYGDRMPEAGAYATCMGIFLKQKREGKPLTIVGDGSQRRDFTFVMDIVDGLILAMRSPNTGRGEVINLGTGTNISIKELADLISPDQTTLPVRPGEAKETQADNARAAKLLGWKPTKTVAQYVADHQH